LTEELVCRTQRSDEGRIYSHEADLDGDAIFETNELVRLR